MAGGIETGNRSNPMQGEFQLGIPRAESPEDLARKELIVKADAIVHAFAEKVTPILNRKVRNGEGKTVISPTQEGRPEEELTDIDQTGENILKQAIRDAHVSAVLFSETTPEPLEFTNGEFEKIYIFQDPFDNTSQYKRGLDTPPYSVVGIYDGKGQPLSAVSVNIKEEKAYITEAGEVYLLDLKTKEKKKITRPEPEIVSLNDKGSTLASFVGEKEYSEKFFEDFGNFIHSEARDKKAFLYTGGGAYIYGDLAARTVDAYVMRNEPLSEIIPGLALALLAGCKVGSINPETGVFEEFSFNPLDIRANHRIYSEGTVPIFVAASNMEIVNQLKEAYMASKTKKEEEAEEERKLRAFAQSKGQEFVLFKAPPTNNL